ncbi:MAG: class I SAM-dependent methyltransferase [Candidatus Accumulibacter sp.]|nr:class I SAM-dependent methyltransferase [Accumulibacter sp.]
MTILTDLSSVSQEELFDHLAPDYSLLLDDWDGYLVAQAKLLDGLLREHSGAAVRTVLDCTCGIGTQCLGLASLGYRLTGTDISRQSIARAAREADRLGLKIDWLVADVRQLNEVLSETFDAVISCDNSLPALLSEADLRAALRQIFARLASPGTAILSIRDYQQIFAEKKRFNLRQIHEVDGKRLVVFDLWNYHGEFVTFEVLFVQENSPGWSVRSRPMVYRAVYSEDFLRLLREAGFREVRLIKELAGQALPFDHYVCRK